MKPAWTDSHIKLFYRICLFSAWAYFKIFYRLKVYGHEHFIKGKGIIAANHASFFDPPVVSCSWPEEVHFLARDSLFKPFLFGKLISVLNSHPVHGNASDVVVFKLLCKLLSEEKKVILFPEGSRTFDGELQPIKKGISLLVTKSGAPIIPTYVEGTYQVWKRGKKIPKPFGKIRVVFGSPIYWNEFSHLPKKEGQQALADCLTNTYQSLKEWLKNGARGTPP